MYKLSRTINKLNYSEQVKEASSIVTECRVIVGEKLRYVLNGVEWRLSKVLGHKQNESGDMVIETELSTFELKSLN